MLCLKRSQIRILVVPILFMLFLLFILHIKQKQLTVSHKKAAFEKVYTEISNNFQKPFNSQDVKMGEVEFAKDDGAQRQYYHQNQEAIAEVFKQKKEEVSIDIVTKELSEVGVQEMSDKDKTRELVQHENLSINEMIKEEKQDTEMGVGQGTDEVDQKQNENKDILPIKIHEVSMEEPYRSRLINISERCKALNHSTRPLSKSSLKYHDDIKVVMCEVPKVASTTWQVLLLRLGGFEGETQFRKFGYKEIYLKTFRNLANETIAISKMQSYLSFFLTRHPFERLVSAYSDKLTNRSKATWYRETLGRKIAKKEAERYLAEIKSTLTANDLAKEDFRNLISFHKHTDEEKIKIIRFCELLKSGEVSFLHFVRHVIDEYQNGLKEDMDGHWIPQIDLCMPCAYQYSYVIRFDNVVPESQKLLDYLQTKTNFTQKKLNFPKDRPSVVKDEATQKAFMNIDSQYMEMLRKLYADDFYLLDHNPFLYKGRDEV